MSHVISTVESSDTSVTRECECGWVTIGELPEPDHHTPLAQREADHLIEAAKIDDGTIYRDIPYYHTYQLHLQRRLRTGEPNHVVLTAIWQGGSQQVWWWPWDAAGLAGAQSWCDKHAGQVVWAHDGFPVERDSLAIHASST